MHGLKAGDHIIHDGHYAPVRRVCGQTNTVEILNTATQRPVTLDAAEARRAVILGDLAGVKQALDAADRSQREATSTLALARQRLEHMERRLGPVL